MNETSKISASAKKPTSSTKAAQPNGLTKMVSIRQVGSPIGRHASQRQTLIGLGLNKLHKVSTIQDTDAVRGMIKKVRHLVTLVEAN